MAGSYSPPPAADPADDMSGGAGAGDPDAGAQPDGGDGSYVIEIRVGADKQITVCVEQGAEEAGEEQASDAGGGDPAGGDDGDDQSTPVQSIKAALTLALEIFKADGQMPAQADDDFQQGFQGARG